MKRLMNNHGYFGLMIGAALLPLLACAAPDAEAPEISLGLAIDAPLVIGAGLLLDIDAAGCDPESLTFSQRGREITRLALAGAPVPTRLEISTKNLDLSGLHTWPAATQIDATLTCRGGAQATSAPLGFDLLPARARVGDLAVRWPGYLFWPEDEGTFLFCDGDALVRLDADREAQAASPAAAPCSTEAALHRRADRLILIDSGRTAVFDRASLALIFEAEADAISLGDDLLALARQLDEADQGVEIQAIDLKDGALRRQVRLDAPGSDWIAAAPLIDGRAVTALTVAATLSPLEARYDLWRIDVDGDAAPERVASGSPGIVSDTFGDALVIPTGHLLSPRRALIAQPGFRGGVVGDTHRLMVLELPSGQPRWSIEVEGQPKMIPMEGGGLLVHVDNLLIRVDVEGEVVGQWEAPRGAEIQRPAFHPEGGVLAALRYEGDTDEGAALQAQIAFLDANLDEVWIISYPWASGVSFSPDGAPWFLSLSMLRLHDAATYRTLIR